MATVQKRRNGRRNNQEEEIPNKLKRKSSKILEHGVTQDETPVSNVVVPMEIEEEIKPISNGISLSSPPSQLQKEQTSTPAVTPSKKSTTPRKRKTNKPEEKTSDNKTETISADQPVIKEEEQSVAVVKKEKQKRNRVLPPRGKKVNNEIPQPQTQSQPTTQPQSEITQEQTPPPQQSQPEKSTSPIQLSQKTRSPSTQKRKAKASAITGPVVKEKSLNNATPVISLEEASIPVLKEPKQVLKEEINEAKKSQKKNRK